MKATLNTQGKTVEWSMKITQNKEITNNWDASVWNFL